MRLLECAWLENSSLAIQFSIRFRSPKIIEDIRLLLLSFPEKATAEPDALKILLGNSLPNDVSAQMKVASLPSDSQQSLTVAVPTLLESRQSRHSCYVFLARIQESPARHPIRHACLGKPLGGYHFLLCAPDSTNLAL